MATATVGIMQEFQPGSETIAPYLERLKAYLDANDVAAAKRGSFLVSTIGPKTHGRAATGSSGSCGGCSPAVFAVLWHWKPCNLKYKRR